MIVKVQHTDGWQYFGDVIHVNTFTMENAPDMAVGTVAETGVTGTMHCTRHADLRMKDGESATIELGVGAYLLDDNGNTIEKL